jgi:DNA-binding response OmpR family regulator
MIEEIRTILITEPSDLKKQLSTLLHQRMQKLVVVDSTVDGLAAVKRAKYDAAIVSADMDDYYSVDSMVKILQDVGSIQYIILIS